MRTLFNPIAWVTWLVSVSDVARANLPTTGNITLFYSTTCGPAVFVNSAILGADVCGPRRSELFLNKFGSFVLNERPFCSNGSRPYFNLYADDVCSLLPHSYAPGPLYNPTGPDADGTCVAPSGGFSAMAFICDGLPGGLATSTLGTTTSRVISTSLAITSRVQSTSSTEVKSTVLGSTTSPTSIPSGTVTTSTSSATVTSAITSSSVPVSTAGAALAARRPGSVLAFVIPVVAMVA